MSMYIYIYTIMYQYIYLYIAVFWDTLSQMVTLHLVLNFSPDFRLLIFVHTFKYVLPSQTIETRSMIVQKILDIKHLMEKT